MKSDAFVRIAALALFAGLTLASQLTAQELRYKLIVIGTLGGPQSYGGLVELARRLDGRYRGKLP